MPSRTLAVIRYVSVALIFVLGGLWFGLRWQVPPTPPEPVVPVIGPGDLVEQVPEFTLNDLDSQSRTLRDWDGQTLFVNFWATWCAPCRHEMPLLQSLADEKRDEAFQVIGIAIDRVPDVVRFITESGVTYPQLVGQQDAMDAANAFGPEMLGLPFSVFIGPGGEVLGLRAGAVDAEELAGIVRLLDAYATGQSDLDETRAALAAK